MFGSKSQSWISMMTISVILVIIFGSLAHGDIAPGTKTHGEACKNIHGDCDFDKKLLICIKQKCKCIEPSFYGYPKKGGAPPSNTTSATTTATTTTLAPPAARSGRSNPQSDQDFHIPAQLEWSTEEDNCVVKKGNPCQLDYKDKDIFRTCGSKNKCEADSKSPQDDLGLCKSGKGDKEDKTSRAVGYNQVSQFVIVFSYLVTLFFSLTS